MRTFDELSLAKKVARLPQIEREAIFAGYTQDDYASLDFDWGFWARPEQLAPPGNWDNWLILAGRGFGKTRTGAEWVRANMCGDTPLTGGRWRHVALIAETAADARDVMVGDGKMLSHPNAGSGILQVHPADFRPHHEPSKRRLTWPNGAIATLYNAVEPDQLRGPQHDAAWCDELAKWQYAQDTWDQLQVWAAEVIPRGNTDPAARFHETEPCDIRSGFADSGPPRRLVNAKPLRIGICAPQEAVDIAAASLVLNTVPTTVAGLIELCEYNALAARPRPIRLKHFGPSYSIK